MSLFRHGLGLGLGVVLTLTSMGDAGALPFSAASTSRESKKITAISPTIPFTRTYEALAADSKDLTFQELPSGRSFLAFSSLDGTFDDLGANRCATSANYQVYWADKFAALPGVCLSWTKTTGLEGDASSINPRIAGADGDEGRYIAFESDATNLAILAGTANTHQIYLHDRKWERNFLSASQCDPATNGGIPQGGTGPSHLWQMTDDGQHLALTTSSTNTIDNLSPTCADSDVTADVFVRDGGQCTASLTGACRTSVLYEDYALHAGGDLVETLNEDSANVSLKPDLTAVVFDTAATNPTYFNPDIRGFRDIYYHQGNKFSRITQTMLPFCSSEGELLPLTNEYGPSDGDSERPSIDESGRYVAFDSLATDLVVLDPNPAMVCSTPGSPHPATFAYVATSGKRQIYLYDKLNKRIEMISRAYAASSSTTPAGANDDSENAKISRDGRFIVFESKATNLLSTATSAHKNIFVYDRYLEESYLVTTGTGAGTGIDADAELTQISNTGLSVGFHTRATDVVTEDASQGGVGPTCGGSRCQQVYIARHNCPLDTDADLVPDCLDSCPNDAAKSDPQQCGCGEAETDADADFTPDCLDGCDADVNKTSAGACGCGVVDTDSDGDGNADCIDSCPIDNGKLIPGLCGCGVADTDTDSDGAPDCNDSCPTDPAKSSAASCPCGAIKNTPGQCGCNIADTDANGNGQADCLDPSSVTMPTVPSFSISRISLASGKTYNILRVKMQGFGKSVYHYKLTKTRVKIEKTSTSSVISINAVPKGTYTFAYYITSGTGVNKITTQTRTVQIKVP